MKKNSVIFLTSVISVIFALSLFYFGFNIYRENKNASYSSEQKFNELFNFFKNDIKNASLENSTINFSDFKFILIEKNSSKIEAYPDFNIDLSKEEIRIFQELFQKKSILILMFIQFLQPYILFPQKLSFITEKNHFF